MSYLAAFAVSYLYVGMRATQQLQVVSFMWFRIMPVSLVMGFCEVFIGFNVFSAASEGVPALMLLATCIGTGSGLGCLTAMFFHWRGKKRRGER